MELELFPLKYEVSYKGKSYIIKANNYFSTIYNTYWSITFEGWTLCKNYEFIKSSEIELDIFSFNTKEEAINALSIYLTMEDKLEKERIKYKTLKDELKLSFLYNAEDTFSLCGGFLSVHDIEAALNKKGCFRISKSNRDSAGVQISVSFIHNILLLEKVIEEIAKENNCNVINIYNHDVPHCNHTSPLYYYWQCGNDFVRQFALLKQMF